MSEHRWSTEDEIACVGAWYAHDGKVPESVIRTLARLIHTTEASVIMKMGNISSVVTGRGLDRVARATRVTVEEFKGMTAIQRNTAYREATDTLRGHHEPITDPTLTAESQARLDAAMARRRERMGDR